MGEARSGGESIGRVGTQYVRAQQRTHLEERERPSNGREAVLNQISLRTPRDDVVLCAEDWATKKSI